MSKDITGKRFGSLIVVKRSQCIADAWLCRCDCGGKARIHGPYLRNGKRQSCGCTAEQLRATGLKCVRVGKHSPRGTAEDLEDLVR